MDIQDFDSCLHGESYMLAEIDLSKASTSQQADQPIIAQLLSKQVFRHGTFFPLKMIYQLLMHKQCSKSKMMSQENAQHPTSLSRLLENLPPATSLHNLDRSSPRIRCCNTPLPLQNGMQRQSS